MPQQSLGTRFAPAEVLEHVHRVTASSLGENRVAEAAADAGDRLVVLQARLFKGTIGVGTQHLGPLVTVITGRVAA